MRAHLTQVLLDLDKPQCLLAACNPRWYSWLYIACMLVYNRERPCSLVTGISKTCRSYLYAPGTSGCNCNFLKPKVNHKGGEWLHFLAFAHHFVKLRTCGNSQSQTEFRVHLSSAKSGWCDNNDHEKSDQKSSNWPSNQDFGSKLFISVGKTEPH